MKTALQNIIDWLAEIEPEIEYGHINISIIKHQGDITKIVKNATEVEKIDQKKKVEK